MVYAQFDPADFQPLEAKVNTNDRSVSVGTVSTLVLRRNSKRVFAILTNNGANAIHIQLGAAATAATGVRLNPYGGSFQIDRMTPWNGEVYAIAETATTVLTGVEVETE